ncbi:DUF4136 domain-containing protein [Aquimarina algicola]|uniref:DUF4136 domain-containing protein n=1 Tax=Aquimarina algicola TaxID=2589995 RepID=A0A504JCG9_9FLAO|nr:DUF4136 domain-containing protein [Aquimarina algicola]TPN84021.1 DUF4136 domain-containing protein [Aquimarina algicola]
MKYIGFLFLALMMVSCGSTQTVYDYDEQQDFSVYKTFAFYPEMNSGLSELDQKRLLAVTEEAMNAKGLVFSNTPDIFVNFKTERNKTSSRNSIGVGVGSGGRGVNIGIGGAIPIGGSQTYLKLTMDFVDASKDQLIWQAVSEKQFYPNASPNTRTQFFQRIVAKALAKYPPKRR